MLKNPALLILYEATTALDPKTEKEICATLGNLKGSVTILAISHQSARLESAELAYRVQAGAVQIVKGPCSCA